MARSYIPRVSLVGQRFGRWLVLGLATEMPYGLSCRCDCGTVRDVLPQSLRTGASVSCGCSNPERRLAPQRRNPHRRNPLFWLWQGMLDRCQNPNAEQYPNYGGRGITVCERWLTFENFLLDMGDKPSPGHSIDRICNDGNYEPENCRWATQKEQTNNRRGNWLLEWNERTQTVTQWAEEMGIDKNTLRSRLLNGWSAEAALTTPVDLKFRTQGGSRVK